MNNHCIKCHYCDKKAIAYNPFNQNKMCEKHYKEDLFELETKLYYR